MNIQAEGDRWYPLDHEVDDPFGETGVARSDPYGYNEYANRAFVAGAEWARKEALREAGFAVSDLLGDPAIYSTAAVTGVIRSLAVIRALAEEVKA